MIRVAQIMGYMNGGGVEAVVMNYYRHIDRATVQFDFIVCDGSTLIPYEEIEALGGHVFMVPSYTHVVEFQKTLVNLFQEQGWEIVHSHLNALSVFSLHAAKIAKVPIRIAHSHSTAGKGEFKKNVAKNLLRPFANVYPTYKFACSQYAGKWLFGKNKKFEIMYNAIDLQKFAFDSQVRKEMRAELGIKDNEFVIGHVGRFLPQKNHKFLIDIFSEVVKRRPDTALLLVGDGELRYEVEHYVEKQGLKDKVKFLGQRSDAWRLYQAFDVFVLPSLYEGLCLVGIEAQRAGLPCLLSDRITREVDVTKTCKFLPIDDGTGVWVNLLSALKSKSDATRAIIDNKAFFNYDIVLQGNSLTEKYTELARKAGISVDE